MPKILRRLQASSSGSIVSREAAHENLSSTLKACNGRPNKPFNGILVFRDICQVDIASFRVLILTKDGVHGPKHFSTICRIDAVGIDPRDFEAMSCSLLRAEQDFVETSFLRALRFHHILGCDVFQALPVRQDGVGRYFAGVGKVFRKAQHTIVCSM